MNEKAIGILGGMGPLATVDLFKKIVLTTKASCDEDHVRVYIDNNAPMPDRATAILHGGESPLPAMFDSISKLEACGSSCIVMPCNTAHYFLPELRAHATVPFLSILDTTAEYCEEVLPGKTAFILGTPITIDMHLYDDALSARGIKYLTPGEEGMKRLVRIIYDLVKAGRPIEECREDMEALIAEGKARGADYFILGCTELPIVTEGLGMQEVFVDATYTLARAAIRFCGYETL